MNNTHASALDALSTHIHPRKAFDPIDIICLGMRSGVIAAGPAERAIRMQYESGNGIAMLLADGHLQQRQLDLLRLADPNAPVVSIAGYRIDETIGHGGFGIVYRATGGKPLREVALKVIRAPHANDEAFRSRFLVEAAVGIELHHPNVVAIYDFGADGDRLYLVMELITGGDAKALACAPGGMSPQRALSICIDAASGLEAIHAANLVHRDIKPANILLTSDGQAKVADLGLVRVLDHREGFTAAGTTPGTAGFMAPEQARKDPTIDGRADIYALGATLYYLVTAEYPFSGDSEIEVLSKAQQQPLPDPRLLVPSCPAGLAAVILRAGRLAREERYQSARAMREALTRVREDLPSDSAVVREIEAGRAAETRLHAAKPPVPIIPQTTAADLGSMGERLCLVRAAQQELSSCTADAVELAAAGRRLVEIAERLKPLVTDGHDPFHRLVQLTVDFLRKLEAWPSHITPGSIRTAAQALERMERHLVGPEGAIADLTGAKAMMVDDDRVSLTTACSAMGRSSITPVAFSTAEAALAAAGQTRFSLVFTDLMMSGMNGFQLAARLRAIPGYADVPIVFVTGIREVAASFRSSEESANDIIIKPFLLTELALKALIHIRGVAPPADP
ncbi:MAG: protein kinase [Planctomycetes bacterium]|nr:protein kinase [Planctomycetota bacterium]